jgi:hypothetical protein
MPNHIDTNVLIKGSQEDKDAIRKLMDVEEVREDGNDAFDLNGAIKMPKNITDSKGTKGLMPAWYTWSVDNWGTKWNSYNCMWVEDNSGVSFQTAWSTPEQAIHALSKKFPDVTFVCIYADEDTGSNTGIYVYKDGDLIHSLDVANDRQDISSAFAIQVQGTDIEAYEDDEDEWMTEVSNQYDDAMKNGETLMTIADSMDADEVLAYFN